MEHSIRVKFDQELNEIHGELVRMSQMVEQSIERAMRSLVEQDLVLAAQVIAEDHKINELRFEIEKHCLDIIARQQPIARDLRLIIAVFSSGVELERMGDHSAGIAKTVIKAADDRPLKPGKRLIRMADLSRQMLKEAIAAFVSHDAERAQTIANRDTEMDRMYKELFDRLVEVMSEKPKLVKRATYLMWCGHCLERIADRVTNLAEQVIFMTTGDLKEIQD